MSDFEKDTGIEYVMNNIIKAKILGIAKTIKKEGSEEIKSDVAGSYTGFDKDDIHPIQDVDDL